MPPTINQRMGAELEGDFVDRHVDLPVEGFNEEINTPCAVQDAMDLNCAMHELVEDEVDSIVRTRYPDSLR